MSVRITQEELAFLLGLKEHSAISRLEQGEREPNFRLGFAYAVLFEHGLQDLFPNVHREVRGELAQRVEELSARMAAEPMSKKVAYKLRTLAHLKEAQGDDAKTL